MRKIIYVRCSTDTNGENKQTPELQLNPIWKSFPQSKDAEVFIEKKSAYKNEGHGKRPVWDGIMNDITESNIKAIYLFDLDRAYRNRSRLKELFILCKKNNCKIHSVNQEWLEAINNITPPFNEIVLDLVINLLGWMSEDESKKKSERIKMAVDKTDGKAKSYKGNKWGRKADLTEADVNKMLELRNQGLTLREIASNIKRYDDSKNEMVSVSAKTVLLKLRELEK